MFIITALASNQSFPTCCRSHWAHDGRSAQHCTAAVIILVARVARVRKNSSGISSSSSTSSSKSNSSSSRMSSSSSSTRYPPPNRNEQLMAQVSHDLLTAARGCQQHDVRT